MGCQGVNREAKEANGSRGVDREAKEANGSQGVDRQDKEVIVIGRPRRQMVGLEGNREAKEANEMPRRQ